MYVMNETSRRRHRYKPTELDLAFFREIFYGHDGLDGYMKTSSTDRIERLTHSQVSGVAEVKGCRADWRVIWDKTDNCGTLLLTSNNSILVVHVARTIKQQLPRGGWALKDVVIEKPKETAEMAVAITA